MIGSSLPEYVFIRSCIFLVQYLPLFYVAGLAVLFTIKGGPPRALTLVLLALLLLEILYAVCIYLPYIKRLSTEAKYPPPLSASARRSLFDRVVAFVPDPEKYVRTWFLGANLADIRQENIEEFLLWAFFDRRPGTHQNEGLDENVQSELGEYVAKVEALLGKRFDPGRGKATSLRLTIDEVGTTYRTFWWYVVVGIVDAATHCVLAYHGFRYYAQPLRKTLSVFPPRPQQVFARHRSPGNDLSYWLRPHTSKTHLPVLFLHGIGIGLWTYTDFLAEINPRGKDVDGQIGIIAIEILPVSFRLTPPPLEKPAFLQQVTKILALHGWDKFVLVSHSYGSILTTHMMDTPEMHSRIPRIVLIDPVSILLHLPDVAYNFTRRRPRRANEFQLWYFASQDPGVARCLSRYFFWRENAVWLEDLLGPDTRARSSLNHERLVDKTPMSRKVTVCLSGRDLIVDTHTVATYLANGRQFTEDGCLVDDQSTSGDIAGQDQGLLATPNVNLLWFPRLDHAQVFDRRQDRGRVIPVIRSYCAI